MSEKKKFVISYGRFEVDPEKMKPIKKDKLTKEDIDRIIKYREEFLERMHLHFAKRVYRPTE